MNFLRRGKIDYDHVSVQWVGNYKTGRMDIVRAQDFASCSSKIKQVKNIKDFSLMTSYPEEVEFFY